MDEDDKMFDELILNGALEPAGMDIETGEMLYNFTDKLKSVDPALHNEFSKYFSSEVTGLWENGFLDMDITQENPIVSITPKALDPEQVAKLDKDRRYTLKEIIRIIINRG
jgi:hypothetical protein